MKGMYHDWLRDFQPNKFIKDDVNKMVLISKEEKEKINRRFPRVHIARTMKQKSKRHKYYCEETRAVMKYLEELRGEDVAFNE